MGKIEKENEMSFAFVTTTTIKKKYQPKNQFAF